MKCPCRESVKSGTGASTQHGETQTCASACARVTNRASITAMLLPFMQIGTPGFAGQGSCETPSSWLCKRRRSICSLDLYFFFLLLCCHAFHAKRAVPAALSRTFGTLPPTFSLSSTPPREHAEDSAARRRRNPRDFQSIWTVFKRGGRVFSLSSGLLTHLPVAGDTSPPPQTFTQK